MLVLVLVLALRQLLLRLQGGCWPGFLSVGEVLAADKALAVGEASGILMGLVELQLGSGSRSGLGQGQGGLAAGVPGPAAGEGLAQQSWVSE